jgi:hypothetical protein
MKSCEFSETQFSFCFTFEYLKQFLPIIPLPIFPNIREEGRMGGGYDVRINGNIYFQFKIPNYYNKRSNFNKYWNVFKHEYYKIKLETDKNQYKFLKALQSPNNLVYYVTPEFHLLNELSNNYNADTIGSNSALFSIENLPPYGSGYHNLIYSPRHPLGHLFSAPVSIKKTILLNPLEYFSRRNAGLTIYQQALLTRGIILDGEYQINKSFELNPNQPIRLVKEIYTILLTNFNLHWYPIY